MVIRTGLKSMLNDYYSQLRFFEANNEDEILHILKHNRIDLLIMDLQIPDTDVIGLMEMIAIKYPRTIILAFSMLPEKIYGRRVIKAGAYGFLSKDSTQEEMRKAFDLVLNEKKYISPVLAAQLEDDVRHNAGVNPFDRLSHREFLIVNLLLNGNTITYISKLLNIKPSTVGTYKTRIFEKLKVSSVFELKELSLLYDLSNSSPAA
jgi:two-component system invasion response regulator UvrY